MIEKGYSRVVFVYQGLVGYLKFHQLGEERSVAGCQACHLLLTLVVTAKTLFS